VVRKGFEPKLESPVDEDQQRDNEAPRQAPGAGGEYPEDHPEERRAPGESRGDRPEVNDRKLV
jgi:hypothetical protein